MTSRYQALSLDLWFTTLTYERPTLRAWREARQRVLRQVLDLPGPFPPPEVLARAQEAVRTSAMPGGVWRETLEPARYLELMAERLGGRLRGSSDEAGQLYSDAGLAEAPPVVNPEAAHVAQELTERGVPVLAITNTARRGVSWQRFFERNGGPKFQTIVTSCEVGHGKPSPQIFEEAAARLGMPCSAILHVGDRWDLDVVGAREAGAGRALYHGLWDRYEEQGEVELNRRLDDRGDDVLRIGRLDELL
ncbi:MAG: HAD-IA family hydrolase, partial [Euryarchaeota archaeon]|nr:HAD-IA family hydrolase [Euryarchaeota archaeon]